MFEYNHKYDDIINMPHHVSKKYEHVPADMRAEQFASFEALVGFDDDLDETARQTDKRLVPDEEREMKIDANIRYLVDYAEERPEVKAIYFVEDELKTGGTYVVVSGRFKQFLEHESSIVLTDGTVIPVQDIWDIRVKGLIFK